MENEILKDLGLSPSEIKVYLALLELGSAKAGEVIKASGLQNSVVHSTLGQLVEKGLASFVLEHHVKIYSSTSPKNLLRWIDEKKERFQEALPGLLARQCLKEKQEAEVFEGHRGFRSMCYSFIEGAEPGSEYLIFAFSTAIEEQDREVYRFYREFTNDRLRRGLVIKGIAPLARKPLFKELDFNLEQWIFVNFPTLENVSICRNKIIMTPWQYKPVSFLITSRQLADNYRDYFNSIWDHYHS
ncbi:MAG TPA: helix-turn-helix domain-containing protein [Oligoflexia bacterium]|nr:helix-turn-helix domain-containing protein [Oligoflexia bacterium]HMP48375.1 helix-turn-helix domain-containing protein [Oligoflexia bacterium]